MAEKFLMPKLSPTMEEGQIARWVKNEGDKFDANETLAEVDTDKATMEMTALSGGTLLKILKQAGESASPAKTSPHFSARSRPTVQPRQNRPRQRVASSQRRKHEQ